MKRYRYQTCMEGMELVESKEGEYVEYRDVASLTAAVRELHAAEDAWTEWYTADDRNTHRDPETCDRLAGRMSTARDRLRQLVEEDAIDINEIAAGEGKQSKTIYFGEEPKGGDA